MVLKLGYTLEPPRKFLKFHHLSPTPKYSDFTDKKRAHENDHGPNLGLVIKRKRMKGFCSMVTLATSDLHTTSVTILF